MPVGVLHGCEQPMMRQVVGIVDPRDCTYRREDQQVRPEIIPLNMGEQSAMHRIVPDDE